MGELTLALVMIARDEEANIARCIDSVRGLVDKVVVADTGSTDNTPTIAASLGAEVYHDVWRQDFAAARNFALSHSDADWNLILDADEYIVQADEEAIRSFLKQDRAVGRIQLVSETMDDGETNEVRNFITRLIPGDVRFRGRIHEQADTPLLRQNIPIVARHTGYLGTNKSARNIPLLLAELSGNDSDPYLHYQLAKEYAGIDQTEDSFKSYMRAVSRITGNERYAPNLIVDFLYATIKAGRFDIGMQLIERDYACIQGFSDYFFACGIFYRDLILHDPARFSSYLIEIEKSYRKCIEIGESSRYDGVIGTGTYAAWYNLGNYYEIIGNMAEAVRCYQHAASYNYACAIQRLHDIA